MAKNPRDDTLPVNRDKCDSPRLADDQYFVVHRVPPRGVTGDDGNLVDITPSAISFTHCDDIREKLERGEDV